MATVASLRASGNAQRNEAESVHAEPGEARAGVLAQLVPVVEPLGSADEIGMRLHAHLLHDVRAVQLDVLFPGAEVKRNLFVELPGDDVLHDLTLPRRDGGLSGLANAAVVAIV